MTPTKVPTKPQTTLNTANQSRINPDHLLINTLITHTIKTKIIDHPKIITYTHNPSLVLTDRAQERLKMHQKFIERCTRVMIVIKIDQNLKGCRELINSFR